MVKNAAKKPAKTAAGKTPAKGKAAADAKKPVREKTVAATKKPVKEKSVAPAKNSVKEKSVAPAKKPVKENAVAAVRKPVKEKAPRAKEHVTEPEDSAERNDTADSIEDGLRLIQSKPEGILQSELWKELGVDSRKCSRIVKRLEDSGLIERLEFKREGIKTYLLRAKQQPVNPADLLAGDELIPCIGCELECVVEECHPLMDWMYQLAIVEHTEE